MQIRTRFTEDGALTVEVIDPTDGAVTHQADLAAGEQIVVTATDTHSPAGIEFGEVEAIPEPEAEQAEAGETEAEAPEGGDPQGEAPSGDEPGQAEGTTPEGEDGEPAAA